MFGYNNGVISKANPAERITADVWNNSFGATVGWWMVEKTHASAKIIEFAETDCRVCVDESRGFEAVVGHCPGCHIVERVAFTGQDFGPGLQAKAQQAILQHPEATVVYGNYDTPITSGIAAAVRSSGRHLILLAGEGDAPNVALMRQGVESAGSGYDPFMDAWCGVDAFVFAFAGQQPRGCGVGVTLYDANHNLPAPGQPFRTSLPYEQSYLKSWGVS
jgi:ribose transport system substrate-binding protein